MFSNGATGRTMHNLYPLLYNKAVFDVTQEEKGAGIVWSRSGTAGNQRYPVCWSGDPAAEFRQPRMHDPRGALRRDVGDPVLEQRHRGVPGDARRGAVHPVGAVRAPLLAQPDARRQPAGAVEVRPTRAAGSSANLISLRYTLFPYLYSTATRAGGAGLPVLRALPVAFPDDPNVYDKDLEFMIGPWILAAPGVRAGDAGGGRRVPVPAGGVYAPGRWYDYWDGAAIEGPASLALDVPLERIPLYIRGGAIIPMMDAASRIPEGTIDPLIVDVYPAGESSYLFREDEGDTEFRCSERSGEVVVAWKGAIRRRIQVRIRGKAAGISEKDEDELRIENYNEERGEMTPKQRFKTALTGAKPDRLPVTTHHVMPSFLKTFMNGAGNDEFFDRFGLDPIRWVAAYSPDASQGEYYDPLHVPGYLEARRVVSDRWRIYPEAVADPQYETVRYRFVTPKKTLTTTLQSNEHTSWVTERLVKEKTDIDIIAEFMTDARAATWRK